jgi:DnaJ-domain-containing protein 1
MDDAFAILGLERRFDLTPSEVSAAHLRAVARMHPDRAADPVERDRLVRASASAGAAKQRLMDESSRAEELLEFLGARSLLGTPLPPSFLVETMALREEIEAAAADDDEARRAELASRIGSMMREERSVLVRAFRVALPGGTVGTGPEAVEETRQAAAALVRMRYLLRMSASLAGSA